MSTLKFKCTKCDKVIRADVKFAGKVAQCPACQTKLRVPTPKTQTPAAPVEPQPTPTPAPASQAFDPFGDLPSANPSPLSSTPQPVPHEATPAVPASAPANDPFAQDLGTSAGQSPNGNQYTAYAPPTQSVAPITRQAAPAVEPPSFGRSLAAILAAGFLACCFAILWVIIAAFGVELGILAWGIGGLLGLVAGYIGKNPSPVFCGLVSCVAAGSILLAKSIMAAGLMVLNMGVGMMGNFVDPQYEYAILSEMLDNGELQGAEAKVAEYEINEFFLDEHPEISESTGLDEETFYEISLDLDDTVSQKFEALDADGRDAVVARARSNFPSWIENINHYLAAVDRLSSENMIPDDRLTAFVNYELKTLDGEYDSAYEDSVSYDDLGDMRRQVRAMAGKEIAGLNEDELDQLLLDAIARHPTWNPLRDHHLAVMDRMVREGQLSGDVLKHAEATLDQELNDEGFDYPDTISENRWDELEKQLTEQVNKELPRYTRTGREQMVSNLSARSEYWIPESEWNNIDPLEEMGEIGGDDTFWGSFKAVFSWLDLLWFFLAMITAYSVSFKQGNGVSAA